MTLAQIAPADMKKEEQNKDKNKESKQITNSTLFNICCSEMRFNKFDAGIN